MSSEKVAPSNLEYLIKHEAHPLTGAERSAEDQGAHRYGHDAGKNKEADCLEVVAAFLKQDHKEVKRKT